MRGFLAHFAIRVGARRLSDAAHCLDSLGLPGAASVAAGQARLVGALQHPMVTGDDRVAADGLRRPAPAYEQLRTALASHLGRTGEPEGHRHCQGRAVAVRPPVTRRRSSFPSSLLPDAAV